MRAEDLALVVGNHEHGGSLTPATLKNVLQNAGKYGAYAGFDASTNLYAPALDDKISIRFQTVFLPVDSDEKATLEFASEAYNYQTRSADNPRNVLLLATTQGTAFSQDSPGSKKLFHHAVAPDGTTHQYWLEAERSKHKVGGAQEESAEEAAEAASRGKATASVIGVRAMGTRFNVLFTLQVPVKQKALDMREMLDGMAFGGAAGGDAVFKSKAKKGAFMPMMAACAMPPMAMSSAPSGMLRSRAAPAPRPVVGTSNAARVSRGSEAGPFKPVAVPKPERDESQHCTATVVMYYTVAGGVPSEADVLAAIDDLEHLYASCNWKGRLADDGASFMKSELTVHDMQTITAKVTTQPYKPAPTGPVVNANVFPED